MLHIGKHLVMELIIFFSNLCLFLLFFWMPMFLPAPALKIPVEKCLRNGCENIMDRIVSECPFEI